MAEPGFYRCKKCQRAWQRMEPKLGPKPPRVCPHCSAPPEEQEIDQAREDEYVGRVHKPLVGALFGEKPK